MKITLLKITDVLKKNIILLKIVIYKCRNCNLNVLHNWQTSCSTAVDLLLGHIFSFKQLIKIK